jgi:two-component system response regulator RegA
MEGIKEKVALVIDDDRVFRERLSRALTDRGWDVRSAADGPSALRAAAEIGPDLAIVDLRLPQMGGLDVVKELHKADETTCIIVLTGYGSIATALTATKLGASHYLSKPADAEQILDAYQRLTADNGSGAPASPDAGDVAAVPTLARVEWEHIQRVLTDCDGNISQAARLLGLHRRSLQRKLSKYAPRT